MSDPGTGKLVVPIPAEPYAFADGHHLGLTMDGVLKLILTYTIPGSEETYIAARVAMTQGTALRIGQALVHLAQLGTETKSVAGHA